MKFSVKKSFLSLSLYHLVRPPFQTPKHLVRGVTSLVPADLVGCGGRSGSGDEGEETILDLLTMCQGECVQ